MKEQLIALTTAIHNKNNKTFINVSNDLFSVIKSGERCDIVLSQINKMLQIEHYDIVADKILDHFIK